MRWRRLPSFFVRRNRNGNACGGFLPQALFFCPDIFCLSRGLPMGGEIMTSEQKEQIMRLRGKGRGYTEIAKSLGISKNTVKSFCRRNKDSQSADERQDFPGCCRECGKLLVQKEHTKRRIFCSATCRKAWWKAHPERLHRKAVYHFRCAGCGKPFSAYGNSKRKFCTHACYIQTRFGGTRHA